MRRPGYGHVGLLVGEDGAPLSKRHGSTSAHEFRERGFLSAAMLNHLFRLGHASDVDGWLPAAEMPAHFRPQHLGRAPARFDESQLMHWQKETLERMSAAEIRAWLGVGRLDRIRRSGAPQCGAAGRCRCRGARWCAASLTPLGDGGAAHHCRGGRRIFFRGSSMPSSKSNARLEIAHQDSEGAHRTQGPGSVHAAAGGLDRQRARARTRAAAQAHAAGDGAAAARSPCSKSIIR